VAPTPYVSWLYGEIEVNGEPAPAGTQVEIVTPRGDTAGCGLVRESGILAATPVYGEDRALSSATPGFRAGEILQIRVNGMTIEMEALAWQDDREAHYVSLRVESQQLYLPLVVQGE
jgi:hypothetical protein